MVALFSHEVVALLFVVLFGVMSWAPTRGAPTDIRATPFLPFSLPHLAAFSHPQSPQTGISLSGYRSSQNTHRSGNNHTPPTEWNVDDGFQDCISLFFRGKLALLSYYNIIFSIELVSAFLLF